MVHDLVVKLLRDPNRLEILGDGRQRKPFVDVADLVAGMRHAARVSTDPVTVLNVGPEGTLSVDEVADLIVDALGIDPSAVNRVYREVAAKGAGWRGDTPFVAFDTGAITALGWRPSVDAAEAVRRAAQGIARHYRAGDSPLLTTAERRAMAAAVTAATATGA